MKRQRRALIAVVAAALSVSSAATAVRAQTPGSYLVADVTVGDPGTGADVALEDVSAFDPAGGTAVFEPGTGRQEVFTYTGTDAASNELTGIDRPVPSDHAAGTFVQAGGLVDPTPSPEPTASPGPRPSPGPSPTEPPKSGPQERDDPRAAERVPNKRGRAADRRRDEVPLFGTYTTERLVAVAAKLRSLGWSRARIARSVYAPFPIAGAAAWVDTWGAPRFGPGAIVRTHEGQDVFCHYGDPVIAAERGTVEFDEDALGGKVARLRRPDGTYFYYAHLSGWNKAAFDSGDRVRSGEVIGYCGNSGNASATAPHVHFGWYSASGNAKDPMPKLVDWLKIARRKARVTLARATGTAVARMSESTLARHFGDGALPDLSTLKDRMLVRLGAAPGARSLAEAAFALAAPKPAPPDPGTPAGEGQASSGAPGLLDGRLDPGPALDSGL